MQLKKNQSTINGNKVEDIDGCDVGNIDGYSTVCWIIGRLVRWKIVVAVEKKFFKKENPSLQSSEFVTSCLQ